MPKNIEDIIVPEKKRSIRNIPIPEWRKKNNRNATPFTPNEYHPPAIPRENITVHPEKKKFSTSSWRRGESVDSGWSGILRAHLRHPFLLQWCDTYLYSQIHGALFR